MKTTPRLPATIVLRSPSTASSEAPSSSCARSRPMPKRGLLLRDQVCCIIALFTSWIGPPATTAEWKSAAAAFLAHGIGRHSSRRIKGAGDVLGKQEHMPTTRWPSRSTAASDALSDGWPTVAC
ncbi:uncharacterized protein LOC124678904 [Lolium rigidum]|uniref:uncharacterized protein LOC124678904 n=1 Tax=Lolium rigidum TaxID=89674 RepID=UPI001F5CC009|nr:uncharacterized protein LOC124678904 [Lolium rigidum]